MNTHRASNNTLNPIELLTHREPNPISLCKTYSLLLVLVVVYVRAFVVVVSLLLFIFFLLRLLVFRAIMYMLRALRVLCSSAFMKPNFMVLYNFHEFVPGTNVPIHTCAHITISQRRKRVRRK